VAEYEANGLGSEEFCKQKKISFKTLARYHARYGPQKAKGNQAPRLVALEVAGPSRSGSELSVLLSSGRRIEVKRGFGGLAPRDNPDAGGEQQALNAWD
jgi:hypothetical protein